MKKVFDLYECRTDDLESARRLVEAVLGLSLTAHEGTYMGQYYRWGEPYGEEIILQGNFDEAEQEFQEEDFKEARVLLYVNLPQNTEKIRRALGSAPQQFRLLRSSEL